MRKLGEKGEEGGEGLEQEEQDGRQVLWLNETMRSLLKRSLDSMTAARE
jgi:hypothetical protein